MNAVLQAAVATAKRLEVSEDEYFADPCEVPSLSQSIAHVIVDQSLLHAWTRHPKLGSTPEKATPAKDEGHIFHKLLLGKGAAIEVLPFDEYRSNAAKAARDEAIALGRIPVKQRDWDAMQVAAGAIRTNLEAEGVYLNGESEVAFEFHERGTEGNVLCRCRMDHLHLYPNRGLILDLKKIASAHPRECKKHMYNYGYDIQHAAYTRALAQYRPDLQGRIDMWFCFFEIEPPYAVYVARPSGAGRELGEARWQRAVHLWEHALATNHWPAYATRQVGELEPTPWVLTEELHNDW